MDNFKHIQFNKDLNQISKISNLLLLIYNFHIQRSHKQHIINLMKNNIYLGIEKHMYFSTNNKGCCSYHNEKKILNKLNNYQYINHMYLQMYLQNILQHMKFHKYFLLRIFHFCSLYSYQQYLNNFHNLYYNYNSFHFIQMFMQDNYLNNIYSNKKTQKLNMLSNWCLK